VAADGPYEAFENTPTIKITITGLPSSYDFKYFDSPFPYTVIERHEFDLPGMDSDNGTYILSLSNKASGCIIFSGEYFNSYSTSDSGVLKTYTRPGCLQTNSASNATTPFIAINGTIATGPKYTITVTMARGPHYNIRGHIELTPVALYTDSEASNTVAIGGTAFSQTWARSSGDIKIIRRALPAVFCDLPQENADGFVFETIGSITAEIIDL
jgi:hypothetical protein